LWSAWSEREFIIVQPQTTPEGYNSSSSMAEKLASTMTGLEKQTSDCLPLEDKGQGAVIDTQLQMKAFEKTVEM
jgi:hypothetical protein